MRVLLTNDDGIFGHGLRSIYTALCNAGHTVDVVAPITEQSAVSSAITIRGALRVERIEEYAFMGTGVFGTPSDCVRLALSELLPHKPDIVISGINAGANVGTDIRYSGTIAAACEAAQLQLPALALSSDSFNKDFPMHDYAAYAVSLMEKFPWNSLPLQRVININFPAIPFHEHKGLVICSHSSAPWVNKYIKQDDAQGSPHWHLDWDVDLPNASAETDRSKLSAGHITLTPLKFSFTDKALMESLAHFTL